MKGALGAHSDRPAAASSHRRLMNGHKTRSADSDSDADRLVSMKGIKIANSLELQSRPRRASDTDVKVDFAVPRHWREAGEVDAEAV